jgi:hypothetical protein
MSPSHDTTAVTPTPAGSDASASATTRRTPLIDAEPSIARTTRVGGDSE